MVAPPAATRIGEVDTATATRAALYARYREVRRETERLCAPLATEDYCIQSMADVSPPKWHLAHTTWFFETFLLRAANGYRPFDGAYEYLFNSYYQAEGTPYPRERRGLLSRPTVDEIYRYRAHVDGAMEGLLHDGAADERHAIEARTVLGLHHEQQHQELLLTDIKHIFGINPLHPVYQPARPADAVPVPGKLRWAEYDGAIAMLGHDGAGFAFDNEAPRHRVVLADFALASRLVTNGEYLAFMEDGGYRRPELWLADGWNTVQQNHWQAPLYWERIEGRWWHMTLSGMQPVSEHAPVCHVSYYEADAYARWAGRRLPTEAEWEHVAHEHSVEGNFRESGLLRPAGAAPGVLPAQLYGDVWEWTASAYAPYPGYRPPAGALGEYNGKFMCNQMVLRGGSCVSPRWHLRPTYRNFFFPDRRWQFSGIRLADDR